MSRRIRLAFILVYLTAVRCARRPTGRSGVVRAGTGDRGNRAAGEMERHRERGLEGADRRSRCLDADRRRRSGVRHVAARRRRRRGAIILGWCRAAMRPRRRARARRSRAPLAGRAGRCSWSRPSTAPMDAALWQHRVERRGPDGRCPRQAQPRVAEPVSDGQMVYAWFGTGQIVALDMNGKVVWQRHLGKRSRRSP